MAYRIPSPSLQALQLLRSTTKPSIRPPVCLRLPQRTPQSPVRRPQQHPYSTTPPSNDAAEQSEPQGKPNYKIAIYCGLSAIALTWAVNRFRKTEQLDAAPSRVGDALTSGAKVEIAGKGQGDDVDKVPTGTSTIPYFPRTIWLPRSGSARDEGTSAALPAGLGAAQQEEQYQLLGLGVRKVSLFRIQVYVVGLYVAKSDIWKLQEELVKASVGSGASTLVQNEKEELRKTLLEGSGSEKVWGEVLREGGVKSAIRIVPTRNTNFSHLRDGWIRGIEARGKGKDYEGEGFQAGVGDFKAMMGGRGSVGKGRVLLLARGARGDLKGWVEEGAAEAAVDAEQNVRVVKGDNMSSIGSVTEERISRLVWMGYIAGSSVASEEARQSVVEGVMDIVERPIGTVETQVV